MASPTYGKFIAEPFERGFGVTIGNSLRRILLSSLEGAALTKVKIQGVQHEFTTIPGVVEDVTDIVLNLKSLIVRNRTGETKTLRIEKHERGVVTGADVISDDTVEVINKDLVMATMTDDVPLVMELTVRRTAAVTFPPPNTTKWTGSWRYSAGCIVFTGHSRALQNRRHAGGSKNQLRQIDFGNLDRRYCHAGDGVGRSGQDSP